ncbi:hypothetical protein [Treponema zioleckii]|uniref:hypothetical protein n=1 Tax=Treponema zioleckii TaxID=331680 RepID=UPI00168AA7FB|nr:hypothetical protein [Treponema zioleckii]
MILTQLAPLMYRRPDIKKGLSFLKAYHAENLTLTGSELVATGNSTHEMSRKASLDGSYAAGGEAVEAKLTKKCESIFSRVSEKSMIFPQLAPPPTQA